MFGMDVVYLFELSREIGLDLEGRIGGVVMFVVGMIYIFMEMLFFSYLVLYFF